MSTEGHDNKRSGSHLFPRFLLPSPHRFSSPTVVSRVPLRAPLLTPFGAATRWSETGVNRVKDRRTRPRSGGDKEGTRQANGGNRWGKHDEFLHYVHLVSLSLLVMLSLSRLFALHSGLPFVTLVPRSFLTVACGSGE